MQELKRQQKDGAVAILIPQQATLSMNHTQLSEMKKFIEAGKVEVRFIGTNMVVNAKKATLKFSLCEPANSR
jgi:hypothetical protein